MSLLFVAWKQHGSGRVHTRPYNRPTVATISIRVPDDDLAQIDRRARARGMTRTALMLGTVLGVVTADEQRFEEIEERLNLLEASQFGTVS